MFAKTYKKQYKQGNKLWTINILRDFVSYILPIKLNKRNKLYLLLIKIKFVVNDRNVNVKH